MAAVPNTVCSNRWDLDACGGESILFDGRKRSLDDCGTFVVRAGFHQQADHYSSLLNRICPFPWPADVPDPLKVNGWSQMWTTAIKSCSDSTPLRATA